MSQPQLSFWCTPEHLPRQYPHDFLSFANVSSYSQTLLNANKGVRSKRLLQKVKNVHAQEVQ